MTAFAPKPVLDATKSFIVGVAERFWADDCLRAASALSYTSILALVPLAAVLVALAGVFPAARDMMGQVQNYVFYHFLPDLGPQSMAELSNFIGNAGQLGVLSAVFLAVTAALTLSTIEQALNEIWRVPTPRLAIQKVLTYWTMVTLGPLLFGVSLSLSGYAFALGQRVGIDPGQLPLGTVATVLPWALEFVAFTLMYTLLPNRTVRLVHGMVGALVASVMFELLKKGFAIYVTGAMDYRTLYGALAAVPLFLLWMYLSWANALLGAEVAAFLPEWLGRRLDLGGEPESPRRRLRLAIALLVEFATAAREGKPVGRTQLYRQLPVAPSEMDSLLADLEQHRFLARRDEEWWLVRDLAHTTLGDLLIALRLALPPEVAGDTPPDAAPHLRALDQRLRRVVEQQRGAAAMNLAELLAAEAEVEAPRLIATERRSV